MKLYDESKPEGDALDAKPPLGVRPGEFAAVTRIRELLEGLERYAADVPFLMGNGHAISNMRSWVNEINMQLLVLEHLAEARKCDEESWQAEKERSGL